MKRKVLIIILVVFIVIAVLFIRSVNYTKDEMDRYYTIRSLFQEGYEEGYSDGESKAPYSIDGSRQYFDYSDLFGEYTVEVVEGSDYLYRLKDVYRLAYESGYGCGYHDGTIGDRENEDHTLQWPDLDQTTSAFLRRVVYIMKNRRIKRVSR